MEDNSKLNETVLESAIEYGKINFELAKLKAADRISDVASSFLPRYIVFIIFGISIFLFSCGLAFWFGDLLGRLVYGFFAVAAFYAVTGLVLHFFMKDRLKKYFSGFFIRQILK